MEAQGLGESSVVGAQPCFPFLSLTLAVALVQLPPPARLSPWKPAQRSSCPCLRLPGNPYPFQSRGRHRGQGWTSERDVRLCPRPPPPHPENNATDSVILLHSCSFSSLSSARCQDCMGARQGERAASPRASQRSACERGHGPRPPLHLTSQGLFSGIL